MVEEVVEHLVQEAAGALREQLLAESVVLLAAGEQARDREEFDVRERDEVVLGQENVEPRTRPFCQSEAVRSAYSSAETPA